MSSRRKPQVVGTKLKQTTLTGGFNSSPSSSPHKPLPRSALIQKRRRPSPSSSSNHDGDILCTDSDVATVRFEKSRKIRDEDESPKRPSTRKRLRRSQVIDDDHEPERGVSSSDESAVGVPVHWKGKQKARASRVLDESDDEQPRRSKLVKGQRPESQEDEDLDNEVDEKDILDTRLRSRGKKTPFQRNLDRLRRKRQKSSPEHDTLSDESAASEATSDDKVAPFKGAKPSTFVRSESASSASLEDEDNFIVEDDDQGGPTYLPAMFSMNTYQDLAHHFKIICQLFVHMAVRPVHERRTFMEQMMRTNEYFSVPLQVTRRKLSGLRDSLVTSSVWKPEFKQPLETYPGFEKLQLHYVVPGCDACQLGGRKSTLLGRVTGLAYNKLDFEPESSSDSDSDSESESEVKKEFNLGRFCAARTEVFHDFNHWEHRLYQALLFEVDNLRNTGLGFVKVAFAGGVRPPEDVQDGDAVMEWLDQRNVIDIQWQLVRGMMDRARNLEVRSKKGEDAD
ncbi:hypothetical protein CONPUDRAFT_117751 [Coniophora puteana RWD-64-598 SS2]|uniref:DUF4211 domain-containing protein n=1 Tax=Coniophora puteana (strain RWD-64-598) TaxID=741705 RepID=A0A5M3N2C0_CONPW|nr:uncharacterized protein CONPUDRAFT_117751 [Coniophora puteana RWD-64-598 SS2]EIW85164.1 hypothetical protein CONPUDRAFT_117751 [Coniophora puteana RWD-64-598 SS2]